MKTLLLALFLVVLATAFSNGCQQDTPTEPKYKNLYLQKTWDKGQFCKYKVYENFNREKVIDTICIECSPYMIDSIFNEPRCPNEKDFRFVREQEYNHDDGSMTWRPLYIEKIPGGFFMDCSSCPPGKKTYKQTSFLGNTQY
jgi:hypothetical protein